MANSKAAIKSIKQTEKRAKRNQMVISRLRTQFKKVMSLIKEGSKGDGIRGAVIEYVSYLDKAAKVGIIHYNKAARHKSMMTKFIF
ncbi:MAG: 30S ribosomal protein S20 [Puniceicoccales bacterium]|jgi:small subunit ribosomal protein S20|nr:30S ribosomal protein S20 [Puniceicoccales bacterium]